MVTSTITIDGQTTIPQEILDFLKLKSGDRIRFSIEPDGIVIHLINVQSEEDDEDEVMHRLNALNEKLKQDGHLFYKDLAGVLHRTGMKPLSVEDMDDAIKNYVKRK